MKKALGVTVTNGKIFIIEGESFKCICIKSRSYIPARTVGRVQYIQLTSVDMEYKKGEVYDCVIDQNETNSISNPYSVFINELDRNNFTKEEFDEHFMSQEEYRDTKIENILS